MSSRSRCEISSAAAGCARARSSSSGGPVGRSSSSSSAARDSILAWLEHRGGTLDDFVFPSRIDHTDHLSTRQYARLVDDWVTGIGSRREDHATHSLRRTKASIIYKRTGNLRGRADPARPHELESTDRYLRVDVEDALALTRSQERCITPHGFLDMSVEELRAAIGVAGPRPWLPFTGTALLLEADNTLADATRCTGWIRAVAEAWLNGEIAPRATNSLLTIEPSCSTQSRRSWPTRPSKPQVREYGGRVLFPSFGSSHVWPRRWSRRIAYYKRVALIEGTNIVRHELGLPRRMFVPPRAVFRDGRRLSLFRQPGLAQRLGQHRQARLIGG